MSGAPSPTLSLSSGTIAKRSLTGAATAGGHVRWPADVATMPILALVVDRRRNASWSEPFMNVSASVCVTRILSDFYFYSRLSFFLFCYFVSLLLLSSTLYRVTLFSYFLHTDTLSRIYS
uniref:(northern house mosquito) hypothetical protein n=1 Tax=Culex pipiens TaxID=7175 RepID=A0A8D8FHR2_CULPI